MLREITFSLKMPVDFFGVPLEKQQKLEGLTNKEIEELLFAHQLLNLSTLQKIQKIGWNQLDKLFQINVEKIQNLVDIQVHLDNFKKEFKEKKP